MAFDREICALTAYCEASNQVPEARRAVLHTIFNRLRLDPRRFGASPAAVCLARMQFSEWNADLVDNRNLERAAAALESDPVMLDCLAAFDQVRVANDDPTGGATHYHDSSIAPPYWAKGATRTVAVGALTFYRDVP